ncbi:hypothetical protein BASA81_001715 [Batrachochytrium salamandrivorans]|nr:hypothetical protein BASA81_001715 [Batrachochytrium salamandrivorans]
MFELTQELFGHSADVRCACVLASDSTSLVTGSRDRSLRLWKLSSSSNQFEQAAVNFEDHPHWVNALVALPRTGLASGCHDKLIRLFDDQLQLVASFGGHQGPVCSLGVLQGGALLASGSWDGSARVWDLSTKQCIKILDQQENSVCVLGFSQKLVCGSAGKAQGNVIVDSTVRVFDHQFQLEQQRKPHSGPIRCLAEVNGQLASASNDGSVILYSNEFVPVQRLVNPPGFEGSPAFVYCVVNVDKSIATACDDCVVRVWNTELGEISQEIEHPSTVWWVCALGNGDLITTSGDGIVRVFSQTRPASANNDEFKQIAKAARELQRNKVSPPMDVSKLTLIQNAPMHGVKDQHVQVFNKNGLAVAYQFTQGNWMEIGQVMGEDAGGGEKQLFNGVHYDKVVPVEIADEVNGGEKKLQIAFNYSDNPFTVANSFIKDNQLPDYYLDQIVDFIKQNTPAHAVAEAQTTPVPSIQRCFPLQAALVFEKGNAIKAVQKLKESPNLSALDANELDRILEVLNATSRYHATQFTSGQITLVCDRLLHTGVLAERFPVYDLLRAMLLHPNASEQLAMRPDLCKQVFEGALLAAASTQASNPLILCALRMACNLFRNGRTSLVAIEVCQNAIASPLLDLLAQGVAQTNTDANVRLALACLLANITSCLFHRQARGNRDTAVLSQSTTRGTIQQSHT